MAREKKYSDKQRFIVLIRTCACVTGEDTLQLYMSSSFPCSILLPGTVCSLTHTLTFFSLFS